jgi:hypothetical protein
LIVRSSRGAEPAPGDAGAWRYPISPRPTSGRRKKRSLVLPRLLMIHGSGSAGPGRPDVVFGWDPDTFDGLSVHSPPPHRGPENPLFRARPKATIYPSTITGILASGRRCDHRRSSVWVCRNRRARSRDHGRRSPRGLGSDDGRKNPPVALLTTGFNPPRSWIGRRVPSGSSVPRLEVARHSDLVVSMVLRCSPPTWGRYPGMRRTTAAPRLVITRSGTYLPRSLSRDRNLTACTMIMHDRWSSCEYRISNIRCQQKKFYLFNFTCFSQPAISLS